MVRFALSFVGLLGCVDTDITEGLPCNKDSQCGEGQGCQNGYCGGEAGEESGTFGTSATTSGGGTSTATESGSSDSSETAGSTASESGSETGIDCPNGGPADTTDTQECTIVGVGYCSQGAEHVEQDSVVEWDHNPPHSGPHYPAPANWGEFPGAVNRGNWVHSLEHGGVVFAYDCPDGCEPELEILRGVLLQRPDARIILTPDPDLETTQFAAISWTWVYEFESPDLIELTCFVDQHEGHAPEDIP